MISTHAWHPKRTDCFCVREDRWNRNNLAATALWVIIYIEWHQLLEEFFKAWSWHGCHRDHIFHVSRCHRHHCRCRLRSILRLRQSLSSFRIIPLLTLFHEDISTAGNFKREVIMNFAQHRRGGKKKGPCPETRFHIQRIGSGSQIRTVDLRIMIPTL